MKKNRVLSIKYFLFDFIRIISLPVLLWFRPKKYYLNKEDKHQIKGGALIIANHITFFDPLYLLLSVKSRRQHFIVADDVIKNKFDHWLFTKAFLTIPINREKISLDSVKEIISNLKSGNVVTIFPEGHINESQEGLQAFKSGMVMMAMRGNVPIIPIYLKRRKHFYSRLELGIGSPIDVSSFKKEGMSAHESNLLASEAIQEKEKELEAFVLKQGKKNNK